MAVAVISVVESKSWCAWGSWNCRVITSMHHFSSHFIGKWVHLHHTQAHTLTQSHGQDNHSNQLHRTTMTRNEGFGEVEFWLSTLLIIIHKTFPPCSFTIHSHHSLKKADLTQEVSAITLTRFLGLEQQLPGLLLNHHLFSIAWAFQSIRRANSPCLHICPLACCVLDTMPCCSALCVFVCVRVHECMYACGRVGVVFSNSISTMVTDVILPLCLCL